MASTSLGTLTLDLAVRLSEFTDGLTRAEREARDSTDNIGGSVRNMRENITDDISKISGSMVGMAVGGIAVAAAAMTAIAIETAKADVQLGIMAGTANASLKSFQVLTHAAAGFGVEQGALAAILADTQEKLGEFSATGGGGAADFFEALQNNTKLTDEEVKNLGKTLQGKDGVGAIQYLKDELDALGATSQEQRFIMESLAGDLGNLMPLFANGGEILNKYGKELEDAGVIKTAAAIEESRRLAAQVEAVQTRMEGLKTQLVSEMIPALGTLASYFTDGAKKGRGFKNEVDGIGQSIRVTAALVVGLAGGISIIAEAFQQVGSQMRNIGETSEAFFNADGIVAKGKALAVGFVKTGLIGADGYMSVTQKYENMINTVDDLMSRQQYNLSGLASTYYDANTFLQSNSDGLALNTAEAEANAKAQEALAKSTGNAAKSIKKQVEAQARLVGISGNTGIGSGSHLDVRYARGDKRYGSEVTASTLARFEANGKSVTSYPKTSGFGKRNTGIPGASRYHLGTDFGMDVNTPITTKVPVKDVKAWHDKNGGGYVTDVTFEDGVKVSLLHQAPESKGIKGGASGGASNAYSGANNQSQQLIAKHQEDVLRQQEELQRKRLSIASQYATANEKVEFDHTKRVEGIKEAYAKGSNQRTEYMAREEERYAKEKNSNLVSIMDKYMSEENQIHAKHQKELKAIEAASIQDDSVRKLYIDLQNAAYQKDLDNFSFAAKAKAREQDKLYQSIATSSRANGNQSLSTGIDSMARRTMPDDDYSVWRLAQDKEEDSNSVNTQYSERQNQINATDERGEFELPELERFELLEIAKQEHLDNLWAMEQDHALKQQSLDEQLKDKRILLQENAFSAMTSAAAMFFGENSKMHRAAFVMEKAFAVQKALMNIEETYSNTFNAISAIPLIGPYIAMPMAIAASAMQVASAAAIQGMATPSVAGIAHGGLDYVPAETTYLLDKGERVLSPNQNKDFTKFMQVGKGDGLTINNYSSAKVDASSDGKTITISDVRNEIKQGWTQLQNPNSHPSKMMNKSVQAPRRR